jgi:SAM-dependent methyltransferase
MARWDDGYVTDVTYTTNFYREMTPIWLATTALLLGQRPPDLTRPFRYADLGCGNGTTALVVAATCPLAEVWGFDFNPAHVEWANGLAARAGLSNVRFVEASFADLAARPETALPAFDFIASHGVLSWISPENRRQLMEVVRQRLKPGGLAYMSYNVTTGWASMVPVRALMRMLLEESGGRSDQASTYILDYLDRLKTAGAGFFELNPTVASRLTDMRVQDARYLAHEFLNRDWHPLMFADVADEMAEAKCTYFGSATLTDNIDSVSAPPKVLPLLGEAGDVYLRETLRDFGMAQAFRRDVYRRGLAPIPTPEQQALVEELTLVSLGQAIPDPVTFKTPMGSVTVANELYRPMLTAMDEAPLSLRRARALPSSAGRSLVELLQGFTLMIASGYGHPQMPGGDSVAARDGARRLNRALAEVNVSGGEMPRLAAPTIGSSIQVDLLETLLVGALLAGQPAMVESLAAATLAGLARAGRTMQRDGKSVTDPGEMQRMAAEVARAMLERRVPVLRGLGVLEG